MALAWRAGGAIVDGLLKRIEDEECRSSADESPARASVSPSGAGGGRSSAYHRQQRVGLNARLRAGCEHASVSPSGAGGGRSSAYHRHTPIIKARTGKGRSTVSSG